MAAFSLMWVLVAAAFSGASGLVSGRLGTADEVEVPSYFGEAAVVPINAASNTEAPEALKSPILLTEASLQSLGSQPKEDAVQFAVAQRADSNLEKVCERTRQALSAQADGSAMPSGPVYRECMAALAPLRDHQQDSDAVDTLSDCMALVNALVATKGGDCHDAVGVMQAAQKPAAPAVPKPAEPTVAAAPKPKAEKVTPPQPKAHSKEVVAKREQEALDLVSEAMTAVCTETVRDAEVGVKSEGDAMKLANAVAPICQDKAQKHLGFAAATTSLTKEWCHQLDGRLTIALETGFFFALAPEEAERQAAETNPYAATTRRKFCARFVNSLRKQAQEGALYLKGPPPPTSMPPAAAKEPAVAQAAPVVPVATLDAAPLPTLPPAPKEAPAAAEVVPPPAPMISATPVQPAIAFGHSAADAARGSSMPPMAPAKGTGVDMLRLVQALSVRNEWNDACSGMISRLTSEEGSVTEEYALGARETSEGAKVLTFNAGDQGQIRKCAAQLKVLAIRSGVLEGPPSDGAAKKGTSFISISSSSSSADDAEALMDSPWAADACTDIAHGYLTARLAHPGMQVPEYCPLYARDLQAMNGAIAPAERAKQEVEQLRKRGVAGSLRRKLAQAQALAAPKQALRAPSPVAEAKTPAALITEAAGVVPDAASSDEDKEGADFWAGLLQA